MRLGARKSINITAADVAQREARLLNEAAAPGSIPGLAAHFYSHCYCPRIQEILVCQAGRDGSAEGFRPRPPASNLAEAKFLCAFLAPSAVLGRNIYAHIFIYMHVKCQGGQHSRPKARPGAHSPPEAPARTITPGRQSSRAPAEHSRRTRAATRAIM
ncbi:Hypothetical_protein [Hexamita inflata]|uniref:Hypothetical_protein n=1 Tax=Hexamita inflata TaxID=28002 RepID=A0AA86UCU0_9EUKA|nr:Hypothetical protein HINF_LOCUS11617 [Hexamita inflata]CAI9947111.1 Hypothetical protein HINF_LOCUS34756 [Hexamita inflata]CAI9978622.1 Hypothetical protein HINF_LOCUS66267 [Hexamita inflata]